MNTGFLDKLISRLDKLDPSSLQAHFLRLIKEKGLLETVFNALHEGVIVLDGRGLVLYANHSAGVLLGFPAEGALGQPIARYLRGIEWNRVVNLDEQAWSKLLSREIEINYPEHKFLNFYVMPLALADPHGRGAVVIFRDVTRDRENQFRVLQSERLNALTLLAAGVAHEIGNPLNSLHIHLQLMERELDRLKPEERARFAELLQVSRQEIERLHHTITQFLRAIRPSPPKLETCQVLDVLKETLAFMKQEIEDRDIVVDLKCPEPVPQIAVDRAQINQAFFNVIKNALQAMAKDGLLTISVFSNDRAVGLSFQDTGVGIKPADFSRLFEPYRTTKPQGSGLGLMIVQRIIQDHGGEMEVHSRPGRGTNVTLFLPLEQRRMRLLKAPRKSRVARKRGRKPAGPPAGSI
jgi:signal transduction histidine kinase